MISVADLPETIAVFPLPGALLLPRARLPLHIFEPRYLAMLDDALKTPHRLIGMVQPREVPGSEEKRLHSIGCAGRVTQFSETEDGRYLITLSGMSRFRIREEVGASPPIGAVMCRGMAFPPILARPRLIAALIARGFWICSAAISRRCRFRPIGAA